MELYSISNSNSRNAVDTNVSGNISQKRAIEKDGSAESLNQKIKFEPRYELIQVLDYLENSMQVDNTMPLLQENYKPIFSPEEATKELELLNSHLFREQASNAQANLPPEIYIQLSN